MQRLLKFLILVSLRVLIVVGLTVWGISSLATLGVGAAKGKSVYTLTFCREGVVVGAVAGSPGAAGFHMIGRATSWSELRSGIPLVTHHSFPGFHFWEDSQGSRRLGISHLASLVISVTFYILASRWGRRAKKPTLQQRLQNAEEGHLRSHA